MDTAQTDTVGYRGQEEGESQFNREKRPSMNRAKLRPSRAQRQRLQVSHSRSSEENPVRDGEEGTTDKTRKRPHEGCYHSSESSDK